MDEGDIDRAARLRQLKHMFRHEVRDGTAMGLIRDYKGRLPCLYSKIYSNPHFFSSRHQESKHGCIQETIMRYGVDSDTARRVATIELQRWSVDEVDRALHQIQKEAPRTSTSQWGSLFDQNHQLGWKLNTLLTTLAGTSIALAVPAPLTRAASMFGISYLRPPPGLVRKSIEKRAALCVNKSGQFRVLSEGYTVMSHVWGETMGWYGPQGFGKVHSSLRKKGLTKDHLNIFFDRCDATWLWVDILAMPEVREDMSEDERAATKQLRNGIINNLHRIYTSAEKVVVLDSLVMQLRPTGSVVSVAVGLVMGRWIARMWTYAEVRLAKKAVIKTESGTIDFDEMLDFLRAEVSNEEHRYYGLLVKLQYLRPATTEKSPHVSLEDIWKVCRYRFCEDEIDRVRALYPLYDLQWETTWSLDQGMGHFLRSFPDGGACLAGLCGENSLTQPYAWAPAHMNLLSGSLMPSLHMSEKGLEGPWMTMNICSISPIENSETGQSIEVKSIELSSGPWQGKSGVNMLILANSLAELRRAIEHGDARFLTANASSGATVFLVVVLVKEEEGEEGEGEEAVEKAAVGHILGKGMANDMPPGFHSMLQTWILL